MKKLAMICVLLSGCVQTTHQMLPDGSWQVTVEAASTESPETIDRAFDQRAEVLCPQGHTSISRAYVRSGYSPGIIGRFTCEGEESLTKKAH